MNSDDVLLWPDSTWCYRYELSEYGFMGDDYQVLKYDTDAWERFLNRQET
jgi:hypothetical protein